MFRGEACCSGRCQWDGQPASLLAVCDALAQPGPNEKALVSNILEREAKKEKLLEVREREMRRNRVREQEQKSRAGQEDSKDINDDDETKKLESEFFAIVER